MINSILPRIIGLFLFYSPPKVAKAMFVGLRLSGAVVELPILPSADVPVTPLGIEFSEIILTE